MKIEELNITSDKQLKKICKDLNIKLQFIGFEEDLLNERYRDGSYILNIGNDREGTHWVCLFVEGKEVFYFDSFKVAPGDDVIKWCQKNNVHMMYFNNKEQFQFMNQELCGIFVICFLYYMTHKKGLLMDRFDQFCNDL